jgi:hypothetical protein
LLTFGRFRLRRRHVNASRLSALQQKTVQIGLQEGDERRELMREDKHHGERAGGVGRNGAGEQKVSPRPVDLLHLSHYALGKGALEQEVLHEAMSDKD